MAIYVFQQCTNPANTAEFDVNTGIYSVGDVLFSYTNGATCWEMTSTTGGGPASLPDLGPYPDCGTCSASLNAWEFENCCTFETAYFAVANGDISSFATGAIIEYNSDCWLFTGNFYEGTSGTLATVTAGEIVGATCEECTLPCTTPTPTNTPTVTPTPGALTKNFYNCCDIGGIILSLIHI